MAVTVASFRLDFPEFEDVSRFPASGISFWLNMAQKLLNPFRWGQPSPYTLTAVAVVAGQGGVGYASADLVVLAGGNFTTAATVKVGAVGGAGNILTATIQGPGVYTAVPTSPVAPASTTGEGTGAMFAATFTAQPNSQYDLGAELFVAHNIVLERRALDEAQAGAAPGVTTGPVASKSVGGVSVSYDVGSGIVPGDSHWNLTIYGTRFMYMVNLHGMGPVSVHGRPSPRQLYGGRFGNLNGPGWSGPPVDQGYGPNE